MDPRRRIIERKQFDQIVVFDFMKESDWRIQSKKLHVVRHAVGPKFARRLVHVVRHAGRREWAVLFRNPSSTHIQGCARLPGDEKGHLRLDAMVAQLMLML